MKALAFLLLDLMDLMGYTAIKFRNTKKLLRNTKLNLRNGEDGIEMRY